MEKRLRSIVKNLYRRINPSYRKIDELCCKLTIIENLLSKRSSELDVDQLCFHYMRLSEDVDEPAISKTNYDRDIVVSLTTIPTRINKVHLTIESIIRQSVKPNKIVLWLDKNRFSERDFPRILSKQIDRGVSVKLCKDVRSYTKLIPALREYPNDIVVTADDDIIYPQDWLKNLIRSYCAYPEFIHCHRAHKMTFREDGKLKNYSEWNIESNASEPSFDLLPTGVAGVLYYPGALDKDVFDEDAFLNLCPSADDVWFKAMSLKNDVKCKVVPNQCQFHKGDFFSGMFEIPGTQDQALWHQNTGQENKNDKQIQAVFEHYSLYDKFNSN